METKEKNFEEKIEQYLITKGGYIKSNGVGYDPLLGYNPGRMIEFIKNTQGKTWDKFCKIHGDISKEYFCKKVESKIKENGLLATLRGKIKLDGLDFKLIYFKPETGLAQENLDNYNGNICECVRQLHFSATNPDLSVDMTLFINGFPLVVLELKNQYTGQNVENAVKQFKEDRDANEPIFRFNERCLVYFAVDLLECKMTTKLDGYRTFFLPFNQGSNGAGNVGGAGNPNNENGFGTSYLWEKVLTKDILMDLIQKYLHLELEDAKTPRRQGKMIFPRYHQLDVVTKIVADVKKNGSGKNYLVQHSAGSGKSNSIAWLAYRLSSLHNDKDEKIFTSVIVVTDRRVLDSQLQNTIYQFDHVDGVVEKIDEKKHSSDLRDAINSGKKIIITTLQKFPFIYKEIDSKDKKFAVIIDEAHSSQTGKSASKLKAGLGNTEEILEEYARQELEEEGNRLDGEDEIYEELASHGHHDNMSFFAFTATPKAKTLQMFGKKEIDGSYRAFHTYSMQQAIEEGFILDVLQNYMTYNMFYRIVKTSAEDPELKTSNGMKQIVSYTTLHPHNLAQKTHIMIEHFLNTTQYKIGGKAKAMVVTSSRLHAVRYLKEFRKYISEHHLDNVDVLVAFSGEVKDGMDIETEPKLNKDYKGNGSNIKENQLPKRFKEDYNVLIVADKYQTGFDEPLLHTMFVDKPLSGVKAVQTLSRLNRTCSGKTDTFILDFVNSAEDIQAAFQPYYQGTVLTEGFDPNNIYEIYERVEQFRLFSEEDIIGFSEVYYSGGEDMEKLNGYLFPALTKYKEMEDADKKEFKSILQAFIRCYTFVIQVSRMMDKEMQRRYIFCKYLNTVLPKITTKGVYIGNKIDLQYYKLEKKFEGSIELIKEEGKLEPPTGDIGKGGEEEPETLSEIVNKINEKYKTNFTNMDKVMEQITNDFLDDKKMVELAKNNPPEQFKKKYVREFPKKVYKRFEQNNEMFNKIMSEEGYMDDFMTSMFTFIYEKLVKKDDNDKQGA